MSSSSLKRKTMKGGLERLVILGMITNKQFIDSVLPILDIKAFSNEASKTIVRWCMEHHELYDTAPNRDIQLIYNNKSEYLQEELRDTVCELLEQVSEELDRRGDDFTCAFVLNKALEFFQRKSLELDLEELQNLLDAGDLEEAKKRVLAIELPELNEQIESLNILTDIDTLKAGFENQIEPLIQFPNSFGDFINKLLVRKGFIGILGPEKRKKTWTLNEIALQGLKAKKNVVIINTGDLDNEEQAVRFAIRLSRRSNDKDYCNEYYSPVLDCMYNQDNSCTKDERRSSVGIGGPIDEPADVEQAHPDYKPCRSCCKDNDYKGAVWYRKIKAVEPLTAVQALQVNTRFINDYGITDKHLRVKSYPSDTITVSDIDRLLEKWALEDGYTPDIIVVDYADIMAPEKKFIGTRHAENEKWKALGKLRHKYNALVVTATQTDGAAYTVETITEGNFSEDKRKYGHVTGIISLNQTPDEASKGIMRLGRFMCRNVKPTKAQVVLLQSIERGMIHVGSFMRHKWETKGEQSQ